MDTRADADADADAVASRIGGCRAAMAPFVSNLHGDAGTCCRQEKKLADRRCCCIVPQLEGDQQVRSRCQQLAVSEAVQSKTEHTQQLDNAARRRNRNAVVEASLYYAGASGRQTEGSKWRSGERRGEKVVW